MLKHNSWTVSLECQLILIALFVCCLFLGLPAQDLGRQAAEMLNLALTNGSCVDDNLQDQVYS